MGVATASQAQTADLETDQKRLTYGLAVGTLRNGAYGAPMPYGIDLRAF